MIYQMQWGIFCLTLQETEEAGPLDLIKSQICDNVALYAQKYDEDFEVEEFTYC